MALMLLLPQPALAHASERMVVLTLPVGPFRLGAALAVAATLLLALWPALVPRFGARRLFSLPAGPDIGSWLGFAALLALIGTGFCGPRDPKENLLPLTLWILVWVGLALGTVLLGDLWRMVNPWRAPARALRRLLGRQGGIGLARLGAWPALAGFAAFAWLEIVSLAPSDPRGLAPLVAAYAALVLLLAVLEGEDWLLEGEFLSRFFAVLGRVAPLWRRREGGRVEWWLGWPGAQLAAMPAPSASAVVFLAALLASVSFDGLHETYFWLGRIGVNPLEFPGRSAVVLPNALGLALSLPFVLATFLGAITLGWLWAGRPGAWGAVAGRLLLTFLPIAAGYHLAHYLVALLTDGQYALAALMGWGEDWATFGFLGRWGAVRSIWAAQFALILGAHLLAALLALRLSEGAGGWRLHAPVTVLMVLYTSFGLWLLSTATAG